MSVAVGDKKISVKLKWLQVKCKFVFLLKIEQSLCTFSIRERSELLVLRKIMWLCLLSKCKLFS